MAPNKSALVVVASGSEDIEFITVVDVLRRAKINVITASVEETEKVILQSNNVFYADKKFMDVSKEAFDVIVIPGGMKGSNTISACSEVIEKLREQKNQNKWYAGICAAPKIVFEAHGLIDDVEAIAYPGFEKSFKNKGKGRVCVSKNCVTSLGPATAMEFALKLVELLTDQTIALELSQQLILHPNVTF